MKKKFIFGILIIIIIAIIATSLLIYFKPEKKKVKKEKSLTTINLTEDNKALYGSFVNPNEYIKDLANGEKIDNELVLIDEYPTKNIKIYYLDNNHKKKYITATVNVIDDEKPIIMNARNITINPGDTPSFETNVMIGDNADRNPKIEIIGNYDINTIGTYNLKYLVTDFAGNQAEQWFKLNVINKSNSSSNSSSTTNYYFDSFKSDYKTDDNMLGIDVSKWQGDINWKQLKNAGCEFAVIRVGYQSGKDGKLEIDPYFKQNIKGANENGILAGIYFASNAASLDDALEQAKWVKKHIKNYKIDLPISFDWEHWTSFSTYGINFLDLNQIAKSFIEELEKDGYKGMLYSSKSYLDSIWYDFDNVWLAHYTTKTTYDKDYLMWQRSNTGRINGIAGDVDFDVLYQKNENYN